MTEIIDKVEKVKKKKKGYFDNELMIAYMTEKLQIRDYLFIQFMKEDNGEYTRKKGFKLIHTSPTVNFLGTEMTLSELSAKYDKVNNEVGKLYAKVAEGMMKRPNFINYPPDQKVDMISDALFYMARAGERYDVKQPNPFAYFSQITFHSYLQSIKNMKKRIGLIVSIDHLENFDGSGEE